eukprot:TRINITY_DN852_c0_g3_i1.p1 TRINITY_DN852_c0_g3~~TRINITY_DN852_c0_g3_i1.p1  ORF type:complete len:483 (-),score=101.98 TRINITY_DN852_c0_g3_i1:285-1619(-)
MASHNIYNDVVGLAKEGRTDAHAFAESFTANLFGQDPAYTLFNAADWGLWASFAVVFCGLIAFDHCVLNKATQQLTLQKALLYTLFWIFTACCFCGFIYHVKGSEQAWMWMSGYMLEWMLSFDNLFVFHLIFSVYGTPEHLKHRPLYIGICGAVFFRLVFLFIGEYLMHALVFMHLIFGSFLIWTGYQTLVSEEDDDEDPSQNAVVQWLQERLPFIDMYDKSGSFFVKVPINKDGEVDIASAGDNLITPKAVEVSPYDEEKQSYGSVDFTKIENMSKAQNKHSTVKEWQTRATMLFLVVCCLEISDVVFAVDSVSAIVAQVPDLFLAYTSAVFAMLGLRATFFIIDVLVHMFTLLKYGVSVVLMFIGAKLCLAHVVHIPAGIVCIVLVSAITLSIVASVIQDQFEKKAHGEEFEDVKERLNKVNSKHNSPACSPSPAERLVRAA